ncbi:MAG: DUF3187 family protein [Halieaceae bacterium]|jgi:hypothetical protein|nr:DUF3187 family protein [Halieaceae bacterium]
MAMSQALTPAAAAELTGPTTSRNLSPLMANLGVPAMREARGLPAGAFEAGWQLHWASHSFRNIDDGIGIELDGETQRHDLHLAWGIGRGLTLSAALPWIRHGPGHLDALIDSWHGFWGFPDGARDEQFRDQLRFFSNARGGFDLTESVSGAGDAEIDLAWRLTELDGTALTAFALVKLPTGDRVDFTGTGGTAAGLGLRASAEVCVADRLSCHLQLGATRIGEIHHAPDAERRLWFAGVALAWSLSDRLALTGQLDAHASPYTDSILADSGSPLWGTLGLRWAPLAGWLLEAQFSEDLVVGSAPDISFLFNLRRRFP